MNGKQLELLSQITRLQIQLQKLDKIFAQFHKKGQYNFANIGVKLDELRTHHQELLGRVQVLQLAYNKVEDQHKKLLTSYSQRFGDPTKAPDEGNQVTIQVVSPEEMYSSAQNLFKEGKFADARDQLKIMVQRNPDHELTDDAYILIGDCYVKLGNLYEAIIWYNDVQKKFPNGNQVDHALLKLGETHYRINACPEGQAFLRRLQKHYPNSPHIAEARNLLRNVNKLCKKR
jgi:TolA-binding protein